MPGLLIKMPERNGLDAHISTYSFIVGGLN